MLEINIKTDLSFANNKNKKILIEDFYKEKYDFKNDNFIEIEVLSDNKERRMGSIDIELKRISKKTNNNPNSVKVNIEYINDELGVILGGGDLYYKSMDRLYLKKIISKKEYLQDYFDKNFNDYVSVG